MTMGQGFVMQLNSINKEKLKENFSFVLVAGLHSGHTAGRDERDGEQ